MTDTEYEQLLAMLKQSQEDQHKKNIHLATLVTNIMRVDVDGDLKHWVGQMQDYCLVNQLVRKEPT